VQCFNESPSGFTTLYIRAGGTRAVNRWSRWRTTLAVNWLHLEDRADRDSGRPDCDQGQPHSILGFRMPARKVTSAGMTTTSMSA
jgi:hypothetical protein